MAVRKAQKAVTRHITLCKDEDVNALAAFHERARLARYDHLNAHGKPLPPKLAAWMKNRPKRSAHNPVDPNTLQKKFAIGTDVENAMARGEKYERAIRLVAEQRNIKPGTVAEAHSTLRRWRGEPPRRGRKPA